MELNPGSEDAYEGYGDYLVVMGQFDKGLEQLKKARDLDPLSPFLVTDYCIMLSYARRYGEAQAQCLASLELDPNFKWGLGTRRMSCWIREVHRGQALRREGRGMR